MSYGRFAQYYDLLYRAQGKDYEREACRLHRVIQRYKQTPGHRLLEVGCGTGEHLRYLQAFYQVQGVDLSPEMLQVARAKLPDVKCHQGDMRAFRIDDRFDAVVCLFGSIGYVETYAGLQQAIANMRRHLSPGGVLVIEPWLAPGEIEDGRTHVVVAEEDAYKVVRLGYTRVRQRRSEIHFHFAVADQTGIYAFDEQHTLGLFTDEQYRIALQESGLCVFYEAQGLSDRGLYIGVLAKP